MTQNVLITGASSGIGLELAQVFAAHGHNLILNARNHHRLQKIRESLKSKFPVQVHLVAKDLTEPAAAREIFDHLLKQQIAVDILINNAGVGWQGPFSESGLSLKMNMLQLNINALVQLSYYFLEPMKKRRAGIILNVASTAAFMPGPYMAVYYASKAFVVSFSEALSLEVKNQGIQISTLCPGPTRTEFAANAHSDRSRIFNSDLFKIMEAHTVAAIAYKQLMRGKRCIIPGYLNKLSVHSMRFTPRFLAMRIVKWLHQAP